MTEERGWEEGGERSAQREKEGNEERSGGGLNASHVKLMRTNLQKLESYFPFTNSFHPPQALNLTCVYLLLICQLHLYFKEHFFEL